MGQRIERRVLIKYTQKNGLSSSNIRKIIQDKYGFLWIATQDGLNRFDGNRFLIYRKGTNARHGLTGVDVRDMVEDNTRNLLYVLPGEGGINIINIETGNLIQKSTNYKSASEDWNIAMVLAGDKLWIGSFNGLKIFDTRTYRYDSGFSAQNSSDTPTQLEARTLYKDDYGNVWAFFSGYGVMIFDTKTLKVIKQVPLEKLGMAKDRECKFWSVTNMLSHTLLIATSQGLRKVEYDHTYALTIDNSPCRVLPILNMSGITAVHKSRNNAIQISTQRSLFIFDSSLNVYVQIQQMQPNKSEGWLESITCFYSDASNNLWIGGQDGFAMLSNYEAPFHAYSVDPITGFRLNHVYSITAIGEMIYAGLKNGLVRIHPKTDHYQLLDSSKTFTYLFQDFNHRLLTSSIVGTFVLDGNRLIPIGSLYKELFPYQSFPWNSHVQLGDSVYLLGTDNNEGVIVWNFKKHVAKILNAFSKPVALGADIVNMIYKDDNERVWILSDKVLSLLSPDLSSCRVLQYRDPAVGTPYNIFFDIQQAAGFYWIAVYGSGVLKLDTTFQIQGLYNVENGLSDNGVYKLFKIDTTKLLITSNYGISLFDIQREYFINYYEFDGLHANTFEEASGYQGQGKLYAGGANGFTEIDPALLQANSVSPRVLITNIELYSNAEKQDFSLLSKTAFDVAANILQTVVYFSGFNYSNPARTTYAYRLTGFQDKWINLGTQNFVSVIGLPPGYYQLQVKAANENGVWCNPVQLELHILPKWYQTGWFKAFVIVLLFAMLYSLYRIRIYQLKKEQFIRSKLASDLHDDLGGTLNSVKVYTNLALMEPANKQYLHRIKETLNEAVVGIRDIIWVLDDKKDTIEDLGVRVRQFVAPLCEVSHILYKQECMNDVRRYALEQEEKRNLYMILKEAINNSLKYADATEIHLKIALQQGKPQLTISDNGKGFRVDTNTEGNGLKNMRFRAAKIKYKLTLDSIPGTTLILQKI